MIISNNFIHSINTFSGKIIRNKIVDVNNININNYYIYNSLLFFKHSDYYHLRTNTNSNINYGNNAIYFYKTQTLSEYTYDFLLTMYSTKYNLPIITSKDKYFKPFQYSIHDIVLYKYNPTYKIIEENTIKKNSIHFLVNNNGSHIIRI